MLSNMFLPPRGEWADLAGTAIASQPVRCAEQAPNYISSSKNQGDNRRVWHQFPNPRQLDKLAEFSSGILEQFV